MSATSREYVFRYSTVRGAAFAVHLAIADAVNANHDWLFWMTVRDTAEKARLNKDTVCTSIVKLVEAGFLERVAPANGHAACYRFLFPEAPVVFDTRAGWSVPAILSGNPDRPLSGKPGGSVRKPGQRCLVLGTEVTEVSPREGSSPAAPLGQEMVTYFVDVSREAGSDPLPAVIGQTAKAVKKAVDAGTPRRVLRRAVGYLAETGKHANTLPWIIGEVEREIAEEARR